MKLGFESNVFYGNCGGSRDAEKVFDKMSEKDLVS